MADDRPLELPEEAIGRIDGKLADLESTLLARINRKPVGDIEIAFRGTPKPGTIFLQGQTLQRADYPDLWDWAQASGSVVAGGYTVGNGTTTFTVPDMRDRVIVGAGGTVALGGTGGAATRTLTVANLPAHDHAVAVAAHAQHDHNNSVSVLSNHAGHNSGSRTVASALAGSQDFFFSVANTTQEGAGGHNHSVDVFLGGPTTHTVTEQPAGSGTAFDNRPPYLGVNVAVWT